MKFKEAKRIIISHFKENHNDEIYLSSNSEIYKAFQKRIIKNEIEEADFFRIIFDDFIILDDNKISDYSLIIISQIKFINFLYEAEA